LLVFGEIETEQSVLSFLFDLSLFGGLQMEKLLKIGGIWLVKDEYGNEVGRVCESVMLVWVSLKCR
jgi:hypothetical protein